MGLLATWRDTFEVALTEIGDISGFTVFDAGPEGYASRVLAQRIGDGRIIGVTLWLGFYKAVKKMVGAKLMKKLVLIYDDMKRMNYIKDSFFDLVVSSNGVIREIEGLKSLVNEVIKNQGEREEYLNEIQEIDKQVKKTGLRTLPYYALYARKIS